MICAACKRNEATVKITIKWPSSRPAHRMLCVLCANKVYDMVGPA